MDTRSRPSSPVRTLDAVVAHDVEVQHEQLASQPPSVSTPVVLPGARRPSISLTSIGSHRSIPPLTSPSDSHTASLSGRLPTRALSAPSSPRDPTPGPVRAALHPPVPPRTRSRHPRSIIGRALTFFGYGPGNKTRKQLVSFLWTTAIDGMQFTAIVVLLSLAAHSPSPTIPQLNEWDACGKPLGAWNAIWTVRTALDLFLAHHHWSKQRKERLRPTPRDIEHMFNDQSFADRTPPPTHLQRDRIGEQPRIDEEMQHQERPSRLYPTWYSRLSALCTMFTIVWFIMAHIFLYTSTDTCRLASPYIWWLTFAILSIMYIAVVEVILIALVVFVIGPLLALVLTVILLILGRHPLQNPHYIKPDIQAIPRSLVDTIPLVVYIPPPPGEHPLSPITVPPQVLTYPPTLKHSSLPAKKPRFRWLRAKKKKSAKSGSNASANNEIYDEDCSKPKTWEDNWENTEYPFVRLEDNRASCAICLLDFEEPKRKGDLISQSPNAEHPPKDADAHNDNIDEIAVQSPGINLDHSALRLEDVGDGIQPLRLLKCGHVFHQTCLDPWLVGVSGRCPTCQRRVEFPPEVGKRKRRRHRRPSDP